MSFKSITDDDIEYCEQEIRKIEASIGIQLDDSADMNCEKNEDYLIKTFGRTYSEQPTQFRFLRGEISFIKQLVEHVKKIVDETGTNSGLHRFKYKEKRARKAPNKFTTKQFDAQPNEKSNVVSKNRKNDLPNTTQEPNELKANLFNRIKICSNNYQAAIDVDLLEYSTIDVQINQNKITGTVGCSLCKKGKPKKVYYDVMVDRWIITNFRKHLQTAHRLISVPVPEQNKNIDEIVISNNNQKETTEYVPVFDSIQDCSFEIDLVSLKKNDIKIEKNDNWLYHQIASQINVMMEAVLTNGDEEGTMAFRLNRNNTIHHLSVANILGDGNCLFAATAHQLFRYLNAVDNSSGIFR